MHDLEDVEDLGNAEDDEEAETGKGTMLAASFLRLAFNCPGNRRQVVTPDIVSETRWLRSP